MPLPRYLNSDILAEGQGLCRGSMFRAEASIWQRMLVSPSRVLHIADAELFLVPWVPACVLHQQWALGDSTAQQVVKRIPGATLKKIEGTTLHYVVAYVNAVCAAIAESPVAGQNGTVPADTLRRIVWPTTKTTGASDFLPYVHPRCRRMISAGLRLSNFALAEDPRGGSRSGGRERGWRATANHCSMLRAGEATKASPCAWLQEDVELKYGGHNTVSIPYDLAHELRTMKLLELLTSRAPGGSLGAQDEPRASDIEWAATRSVALTKWEYLVAAMVERCCRDAACGPAVTSTHATLGIGLPGYEWLSPDVPRLVSTFVAMQCGVDALGDVLRMAGVASSNACFNVTIGSGMAVATQCCADAVTSLAASEAAELAHAVANKTDWPALLANVRGEEARGWRMPPFPRWHWASADEGGTRSLARHRHGEAAWGHPKRTSHRCVAGAFLGTTITDQGCGLSQRAAIHRALDLDIQTAGPGHRDVATGHPDFKPVPGCGLGVRAPLFRLAKWMAGLDYLGEVIRARTPLAPCGWAPQSTRLYEVLALNRVPVHMCDVWRLPFLRSPNARVAQWLARNQSRSDLWVARSPSATTRRIELLRLMGRALLRGFVSPCPDNDDASPSNVWMVTGRSMKDLLRRLSQVDDSAVDAVMAKQLPRRLFSALSWPRVSWMWAGGAHVPGGMDDAHASRPAINAWELTMDALSDWGAYLDDTFWEDYQLTASAG